MVFYLYVSRLLERQLEKTSGYNTKSELAALKCRQLLSDMREYGPQHEKVLIKRTRKGEQRINNCVKYDMGAGYRLTTVMNNNNLFVTFLGSHDETDQWFTRHKGNDFISENPNYTCELIRICDHEDGVKVGAAAERIEQDAYEAELEAKLDETILLSIFQGLNRNKQIATEDKASIE
ncbi:MAG: hypothetical protein ACI8ZB_003889 [Desulforhopalus sp.]|jgi:hypothetical protein